MDDNRDIAYAIFGFGFGVWSFFLGFGSLRRKRIIENIPTSTVRSLAMGLVELNGKAKKTKPLKSALTKTDCVYYRYTVERYQSSGKSGHWVTVAQGDSNDCVFSLDDGTGNVTVLPCGAEFIMPPDYEFSTGLGRSLPGNLINFLDSNSINYKSFIGNHRMRFKEWRICPDELVYVLGTAKKINDPVNAHKKRLMRRIEELKASPGRMKEVDLNKDGRISAQEWDTAVANIEQGILEEELKSHQADELMDVVVTRGDTEEIFIISDHGQKELVNKLSWQAFLGVFGGAALALVTLWYLLFRFGIF
ncbi:MAG: E3 ubiquitin ligase family protein [Candidatus Omnitrophica bacterium]|nr:E3 ubiquitin ligase family protein [Candidatus Omnitrophota bacterium]MBU4590537.1 E3 ubiquitin ligase family protein [Candidatus Omnitrophota bacterium]